MRADALLKEFESTLAELKVLIASFSPDTKLAELMKQATIRAHQESEIYKKLNVAVALLWALLAVALFSIIFIGWLAE